jgi:Pyruvate/2-oxoacid:ferredoxin oxidoreductase delta subunit
MHENLILFCDCQARNESAKWTGTAGIVEMHPEIQYDTLTDLCGLCAKDPKKVKELIDNARKVLLIACYPRAVNLLLHHAGVDITEKIRIFNILEDDPAKLLSVIGAFTQEIRTIAGDQGFPGMVGDARDFTAPVPPGKTLAQSDPLWPAWYPVIDHSRCNHCGQCADFCLFGVYRRSAGSVEVVNPGNCKNNCPACARICPNVAIVFPKYAGGGAIGGSDSIDNRDEMERLQQDTDAILGNDIYKALELRKMKRRSIIREDALHKAIMERDEALEQASAAGEKPGS